MRIRNWSKAAIFAIAIVIGLTLVTDAQHVRVNGVSSGGSVTFPLVSTVLGTAGAPAFTFTGATTYGLYQNGSCTYLAANGAEQVAACTSGTFIQGGNGTIAAQKWDGNGGVAFASLGTPANGTFVYCNNCTIANPCAGAGTGAFAKRLNGAWVCN